MRTEPIRVAQIIGRTNNGGVENYILNYYSSIDRSQVVFDFFVSNECEIVNKEVIESLGGELVIVPGYTNVIKYVRELVKLLKRKNYDVVQANNNALSCISLFAAKRAGYKIRIANSLSSTSAKEGVRFVVKCILKLFSKTYATHYFACSDLAGKWLFGDEIVSNKNYYKINNAVFTEKYQYNDEIREQIREKHHLSDKIVMGTIGRLEEQKNYMFLLEVFYQYHKMNPNSCLIIIGDGKQKALLEEKAANLGILDCFSILTSKEVGVRGMASKYYSAFDMFVLPSLYEGLPTVGVEAQISSLPTFFSTSITEEVKISDYAYFIDKDASAKEWAEYIDKHTELNVRDKGFICKEHDIKIQAERLCGIYKELIEENRK